MEIIYQSRIDAGMYRTLIDRYYRQRPFVLRLPVQFGCLACLLFAIVVDMSVEPSITVVGAAAVAGAALVFGGVALTKWAILRRYKYRADFGVEATIVISDNGITAHSEYVEGKWTWEAYPN